MSEIERLCQEVLDCGAVGAEVIRQDQIVLSSMFRDICKANGCGRFNRCWVCPPDIGDVELLMQQVKQYPVAILYQSIAEIEDSFDFEGMMEAGKAHAMLSQRIQDITKAPLHLTCGGCHLCEKCTKPEGKPCRFPEKALPSMEGYGIDVYSTSKNTKLKYINGANTVTYFGIVLFKE